MAQLVEDRKCFKFFVIIVFLIFNLLMCGKNAFASSYDNCISASGGRGEISSVKWACEQYDPWNSNAGCALWVGSSNSQSTTIKVAQLSGSVPVYMYGMCTVGSYRADNVNITGDNDAFSNGIGSVSRGEWAEPLSTPISLDIARFTSGISPTRTSEGDVYTRDIGIYRCFQGTEQGDYEDSCSSQASSVTVLIEIIKLGTITVKGNSKITSVDNTILENDIYEATANNVTAHFEHDLYQANDYDLSLSNVSYGLYGALDRSTSLSNGSTFADTKESNKVDKTVPLSINDAIVDFCQNISFKSQTWDIMKHLGTGRIYTEPHNDTGKSVAACAKVHHPWNFKIDDIRVTPPQDNIVYSGEHMSLNYDLMVKKNNDKYPITDIPNASVSICAEYDGKSDCQTLHDKKTIHRNGTIDESTNYGYDASADSYSVNIFKNDWTVPDLPAGTEYCLTLSADPLNSSNGYYSNFNFSPKTVRNCYTVAKRPSMQIWGGNIYSADGINTDTAVKYNIANYSGEYPRVFGSWGELGVITGGRVVGFASGATTGYSDEGLVATPGGALKDNFCDRSVLTFANNDCTRGFAGSTGTFTKDNNRAIKDKESIINKMINGDSGIDNVNEVNLGDDNNGRYLYKSEGDIKTKESTLNVDGVIKVVYAKGNIYVSGNVEFAGTDYESLGEVPKVLLYAEKDIYIDCSVSRIDALLVAENEVKTCASENGTVPEVNDQARSNQLRVNGAIIARKLSPDRTYGAATGNNSIVPAEIINFDPTLYLWAGSTDDDDMSVAGDLEMTYTHELAPRQ